MVPAARLSPETGFPLEGSLRQLERYLPYFPRRLQAAFLITSWVRAPGRTTRIALTRAWTTTRLVGSLSLGASVWIISHFPARGRWEPLAVQGLDREGLTEHLRCTTIA